MSPTLSPRTGTRQSQHTPALPGDDGAGHDQELTASSAAGDDPAGRRDPLVQIRIDGKTVRGAKSPGGSQVHLVAAMAGEAGVVAAQTEVGAKTNEIPMIIPLLDGLDLAGAVITADALHCQRATADYLHKRGAEFVLPVKDNQPGLFDALDALPWQDAPITHTATDRGHGRITTRTIQVLPAPDDLPFPHVSQAYLIERHVTALNGTPLSDIAALGVTSLTATQAGPARLAGLVRGQWAIESLHWLRHPLPRRRIHGPHQIRAKDHGRAPEPRDRGTAHGRTPRHHRSHPLGQPQHGQALHRARAHFMILKRP